MPRLITWVWALALVGTIGLLTGCRSAPPASAPAPETGAWKPKSEDVRHRLEGFRAYMRRSYPHLGLDAKDALWQTSLEYVQWLGLEVDAPAGKARLEDTLSSLVATPDQTPTRWLLKGTLQAPSRGPTPTESLFYGVAVLTQTNEVLTIAAESKGGSFAFRGSVRGAQLHGTLSFQSGAMSLSGKAQGTQAPGRISLQVGGRSGHETLAGNFILLR